MFPANHSAGLGNLDSAKKHRLRNLCAIYFTIVFGANYLSLCDKKYADQKSNHRITLTMPQKYCTDFITYKFANFLHRIVDLKYSTLLKTTSLMRLQLFYSLTYLVYSIRIK
jgi:hypothetical protein